MTLEYDLVLIEICCALIINFSIVIHITIWSRRYSDAEVSIKEK